MPTNREPRADFEPALENHNKTKHGWESILERDGGHSRYLNTRLVLETLPTVAESDTPRILNLDTYLEQQLQQIIDNNYEELKEEGKDRNKISDELSELVTNLTQGLSEQEIHQAILDIISKAEKKDGQPRAKLRQEYGDLEAFILRKLRERQPAPKSTAATESLPDSEHSGWQNEYINYVDPRTREIVRIPAGSYFALESALSLLNNPESQMAHHIYDQVKKKHPKKRQFFQGDLETTALSDRFERASLFVREKFKDYKERAENAPSLPEEAENEQDAIRPLTESEIQEWFHNRFLQYQEDFNVSEPGLGFEEKLARENQAKEKFFADGYKQLYFMYFPEQHTSVKPEVPIGNLQTDEAGEVGGADDFALHKERWNTRREAMKARRYTPPTSYHDLEVPPEVAQQFGYKEKGLRKEGRAFRAEVVVNPRDLNFEPLRHDGKLKLWYVADVNEEGTVRPKKFNVYVNLPKEAIAAYAQDPQLVQQTLLEILQTNEGSGFPELKFDPKTERLEIGLGSKKHLNVIKSFSVQKLRQAVPQMAGDLNEIVIKMQAQKLPFAQRKQVWDFENELLKTLEQNSNGQQVELRQFVWDEAFAGYFKQKVGEQKLAELSVQVLEQPASGRDFSATPRQPGQQRPESFRPQESNRWVFDQTQWSNPELIEKARAYEDLIRHSFDNWQEVLNSGKTFEFLNRHVGIKVPDAFNILGERILNQPQRENEYEEFQKMLNMSRGELQNYIKQQGFKNMNEEDLANKPRILRKTLLNYLRAMPLTTDTWNNESDEPEAVASAGSVGRNNRRPASFLASENTASLERTGNRTSSPALNKILARVKKRVAAQDSTFDPEVEVGII